MNGVGGITTKIERTFLDECIAVVGEPVPAELVLQADWRSRHKIILRSLFTCPPDLIGLIKMQGNIFTL
jgi:hypothetical protein